MIAFLAARSALTAPLQALRVWLLRNNTAVMAVLFLVLGASSIGKGLAAF